MTKQRTLDEIFDIGKADGLADEPKTMKSYARGINILCDTDPMHAYARRAYCRAYCPDPFKDLRTHVASCVYAMISYSSS